MAHDVDFSVPRRPLGKADVQFRVKSNGKVIGTLTVSKGSLVWFPSYTSYGYKMGWKRFDEMMRCKAKRMEKRKPRIT